VLRDQVGTLHDGTPVEAVTLVNTRGITARILTYGATLQSLITPDARDHLADIVLGHDDVADYELHRAYFGVTVGRYANRIAGGRFELDGVAYQLDQNDAANTLHGGFGGFDRAIWAVETVLDGAETSVTLSHVSPDGAGGFPGEIRATVTYTLDEMGDLAIRFAATTDRPTILAMTNHALFNLAGDGAQEGAMMHRLIIPASRFTPIDPHYIPIGELRSVAGSVFDFRQGRIVAEGLRDGGEGFGNNCGKSGSQRSTAPIGSRRVRGRRAKHCAARFLFGVAMRRTRVRPRENTPRQGRDFLTGAQHPR